MDPLSISASIVALIQATQASSHGLRRLLALRNAATNLEIVMNEVTDFRALLHVVQSSVQNLNEREHEDALAHLLIVLQRATLVVNKLNDLVNTKLTRDVDSDDAGLVRRRGWLKQSRLNAIRSELAESKQSLVAAVAALNTSQLASIPRLLMAVRQVTTPTTSYTLDGESSFPPHPIGNTFSESLERAIVRTSHSAHYVSTRSAHYQSSIIIYATPVIDSCGAHCPCACHSKITASTPRWLQPLLGVMFFESTGFPVLNRRLCDLSHCQHQQNANTTFEYWLPAWLASFAVSVSAVSDPNGIGAQCSIRVPEYYNNYGPLYGMLQSSEVGACQSFMRENRISARAINHVFGAPLLFYAIAYNRPDVFRMLLDEGANLYERDSNNQTVIQRAWVHILSTASDRRSGTKEWRSLVAKADYHEDLRLSVLHKIVTGLARANLRQQLELNPDLINHTDFSGRTPLAWAASRADYNKAKILTETGADLEAQDIQGETALHLAWDFETLKLLLEAGAKADVLDKHGCTPLNMWVRGGCLDEVGLLLQYGANPNLPLSEPPLFPAIDQCDFQMVARLLAYGADPSQPMSSGETPPMCAITFNAVAILRILVEAGAKLDTVSKEGESLLTVAAKHAQIPVMEYLTSLKITDLPTESADIERYWATFHDSRKNQPLTLWAGSEDEVAAFKELLDSVRLDTEDDDAVSTSSTETSADYDADRFSEYATQVKLASKDESEEEVDEDDEDDDNNPDECFTDAFETLTTHSER